MNRFGINYITHPGGQRADTVEGYGQNIILLFHSELDTILRYVNKIDQEPFTIYHDQFIPLCSRNDSTMGHKNSPFFNLSSNNIHDL